MELDFIKDFVAWGANPYILTLIFAMGLGNVLKRGSWVQNKRIPLLLGVAGAIFFPALQWSLDKDYLARSIPHNAIVGVIIGWAAVGAHNWFVRTFPKLAWIIPKSEDTGFLTKHDVQNPKDVTSSHDQH